MNKDVIDMVILTVILWVTIVGFVTHTGQTQNGDAGPACAVGFVNDLDTSMWQVSNTLRLAQNGTLTDVEPAKKEEDR